MINPFALIGGLSVQAKIIAVAVLFAVGVASGSYATYKIIGWKNDAQELAIKKAKEEFMKAYKEHEAVVSKQVQDKLDSLRANEREIIREIPKIITRDVYRNNCIDADGLQIIERARTGKANTTEPPK